MTEVLAAPPSDPDSWLAAEAELQDYLDDADHTVRNRFAALDASVEAQALTPLRALIREAAEAHRRAVAEHGLDAFTEGSSTDLEAIWDAVTAYRRDTTAVHAAVTEGLDALDLGATLGALYQEARAETGTLAEDAPEVIVREEPDGLIEVEAGDSSALIARKFAERTRRRLRAANRSVANGLRAVVRKPRRPPEPYTQPVPLQALLAEHAGVRIARAVNEEHERVQTAVGQAVARLEAALAAWTNDTLRSEAQLDQPRFHTDAVTWTVPPAPETNAAQDTSGNEAPQPEVAPLSPEQTAERKAEDDVSGAVRAVREAAQTLDRALSELDIVAAPHDPATLDALHDALGERVRRSGYDSDTIALPGEDSNAALSTGVSRWTAWHRHLVERLDVDDLLLALRQKLVDEVEALIASVIASTVHPIREATATATEALEALGAEAAEACGRAEDKLDASTLADTLRDLLARTLDRVDRDLLGALQPISLDRASERAVTEMRQRLTAFVATIPERLTLFVRLAPERAGQAGPTAEVELRRIVGSLLTEEFAARLLKSTEALRQPLFRAVSDAEGVRDVVRYNIETAIEELDAVAASGTREEIAEAIANARELTVDGLARSVDQLEVVEAPLDAPLRDFVRRATETFERGWEALRQRTNAQNLVEAQFLDVKTRVLRATERAQKSLTDGIALAEQKLQMAFRFGRREARRLVQMGQAAAGLAAQSASDRQRTLDALATAGTLHADLPLVYRRLFAFGPTADPSLFVDRTAQLARVTQQYERWIQGRDSSALVVRAAAGDGRTSFVNVLKHTVFDDSEVSTVTLSGRITSDDALARLLADALGLEPNAARTLDMLEATLLAEPQASQRVCIIERIEHLILRAPGGLDLLERALIFLSRTDGRVFWVVTAIESGWAFVERTAPQITGLVDAITLPPLTRDEIEELLTRRHRRSGLPLRFEEPQDPSTLLARRLGKAKTPEERQDILRSDFFDGLFRASGPHPLLALLYWLRAADFEAEADMLTLRPVRPLDFGFIAQFDLPRAFALKALLQHGSLTLEEHDRIFRTTREESFLLFESLHNLRLIRRVHDGDGSWATTRNGRAESPEPVHEEGRYQLHPLAVAPVADALRTRNML